MSASTPPMAKLALPGASLNSSFWAEEHAQAVNRASGKARTRHEDEGVVMQETSLNFRGSKSSRRRAVRSAERVGVRRVLEELAVCEALEERQQVGALVVRHAEAPDEIALERIGAADAGMGTSVDGA